MEKKARKNKEIIIICSLLLFFISAISSFYYFYFSDKYSSLDREIKVQENELYSKKQELARLENEIHAIQDIDKEIESVKKEFFNIAKELEIDIKNGKSSKKIAYLTFDDGPYYNTYQVLDILDEYNVGATFFTTSANDRYCYDNKSYDCYQLYPEYVKHGHTIANHTYTHAIFRGLYNSSDSFMDALKRQHEHVKSQTGGYVMNIMRFPGGSDTANHFKVRDAIISRLRSVGYGYVDWTALDGDGGYLPTKDKAWSTFTQSINDNIEVVLFHDYHAITTSILPDAIEYLENHGYVLLPLFYESSVVNK